MPQRNEAARCEELQRAIDAFCEETQWSCREWKELPHIAALFALRSPDDADCSGDIEWATGWYGNRLHAFDNGGKTALCGFKKPHHYPDAPWFKRALEKGPPRCKKCEKALRDAEQPENWQTALAHK